MKSATLTIKVKPKVKKQAKKIAEELGFSLSSLVNAYLVDLTRNKTVHFDAREEIPSERLLEAIREADEDRKNGSMISFDNSDDAIAYLEDIIKEGKYGN